MCFSIYTKYTRPYPDWVIAFFPKAISFISDNFIMYCRIYSKYGFGHPATTQTRPLPLSSHQTHTINFHHHTAQFVGIHITSRIRTNTIVPVQIIRIFSTSFSFMYFT